MEKERIGDSLFWRKALRNSNTIYSFFYKWKFRCLLRFIPLDVALGTFISREFFLAIFVTRDNYLTHGVYVRLKSVRQVAVNDIYIEHFGLF